MIRKLLPILLGIFSLVATVDCSDAGRFPRGSSTGALTLATSQFNPNFLGGTHAQGTFEGSAEYMLLNRFREGSAFRGSDGYFPNPTDVDVHGYPVAGALASRSYDSLVIAPPQAFYPGNYVMVATGNGFIYGYDQASSVSNVIACTGTISGNGCMNTSCSSFTGKIDNGSGSAGTTLTVTAAPTGTGCALVVGQPISNGSIFVDPFGHPTMITGKSGSANCPACTGTGGTGTYLVNWSQNVASGSINPGIRMEVSDGGGEASVGPVEWKSGIVSTTTGNTIGNIGFFNKNDEPGFWAGQLVGQLYKQRIQQINPLIQRDLNPGWLNVGNMTTWATRKPTNYVTWERNAGELRSSIYIPTVTYALNGISNDYSCSAVANCSGGAPVDKQTVCILIPTSATNTTTTFNLNVTGAKPLLDYHGYPLAFAPIAGRSVGLVFDATLNGWVGTSFTDSGCLINGVPPEAFMKINAELGVKSVWIVQPFLAADPITDYMSQYAIYIHTNYPAIQPVWETPNESWNCAGEGSGGYPSQKSVYYIAADPTWAANAPGHAYCGPESPPADLNNWTGKAGSLLGQLIHALYPSDPIIVGAQTLGDAGGAWNANILSTSYVGQNPANIPIQSGCAGPGAVQTGCPTPFTQIAAYKVVTDITIANYWELYSWTNTGAEREIAWGYCYFYQSAGCASQSSIMASLLATQAITGPVPGLEGFWNHWHTFASTCAGGSGCTPLTVRNYEGTFTYGTQASDRQATVTGSTNAASAVLSCANCGAFTGMTVKITDAAGGTWPSINGNTYTVTGTNVTSTVTTNLNSTGLGQLFAASFTGTSSGTNLTVSGVTGFLGAGALIQGSNGVTIVSQTSGPTGGAGVYVMSGAPSYSGTPLVAGPTLTFIGSANYITYMRVNAYTDPGLTALQTLMQTTIASTSGACGAVPCSIAPSQFNLASGFGGQTWQALGFDSYGYWKIATCTACTISGADMTIGGDITGIFTAGLRVLGGGLNAPIPGYVITGACSKTGAGPAGSNAGDVCPLSQSATIGTVAAATGNTSVGGGSIQIASCTNIASGLAIYNVTTQKPVSAVNGCSSGTVPIFPNALNAVTSGDTLSIGRIMSGNAVPPLNQAGTANGSSIRTWKAICDGNGNGLQC